MKRKILGQKFWIVTLDWNSTASQARVLCVPVGEALQIWGLSSVHKAGGLYSYNNVMGLI